MSFALASRQVDELSGPWRAGLGCNCTSPRRLCVPPCPPCPGPGRSIGSSGFTAVGISGRIAGPPLEARCPSGKGRILLRSLCAAYSDAASATKGTHPIARVWQWGWLPRSRRLDRLDYPVPCARCLVTGLRPSAPCCGPRPPCPACRPTPRLWLLLRRHLGLRRVPEGRASSPPPGRRHVCPGDRAAAAALLVVTFARAGVGDAVPRVLSPITDAQLRRLDALRGPRALRLQCPREDASAALGPDADLGAPDAPGGVGERLPPRRPRAHRRLPTCRLPMRLFRPHRASRQRRLRRRRCPRL